MAPIRVDQIETLTDKVEQRLAKQLMFYKEDTERPLISCEFTNWKPVRMLRIDEFCLSLDSRTTRKGQDIYD